MMQCRECGYLGGDDEFRKTEPPDYDAYDECPQCGSEDTHGVQEERDDDIPWPEEEDEEVP